MEVICVGRGEAPETADRIYIDKQTDGLYSWIGSVEVGGAPVFGNSAYEFRTVDEAEGDAIAWARGHGAKQLFIEQPNTD